MPRVDLLRLIDDIRLRFDIPTQSCVLAQCQPPRSNSSNETSRWTWCFQSIAGTGGGQREFWGQLGTAA
ncbi:hypothetical protein I541_5622 [Mycobacteroides abscessus]|nr:hypothetical protein I541_5622 [Mycobacteroides abscessus]